MSRGIPSPIPPLRKGYVFGVKGIRSDYRPGHRSRRVPPPSGKTPRRFPLVRILLLAGLAAFIYASFDEAWPRLRAMVQPAAWWDAIFARTGADEKPARTVWSRDSSRVVVQCPQGIGPACCEDLDAVQPGLCGSARAIHAKAAWKKAIASNAAIQSVEARASFQDNPDGQEFELAAVRGRDASGEWNFQRRGDAAFCDARRGCLGDPAPRAPLADARLYIDGTAGPDAASDWVSASAHVRAVLPGRITAVDSAPGGVRVRVYHGAERYVEYGPLVPAAGVAPGALVRAGSLLGNAPAHAGRHRLSVRVRQAGGPVPAEQFWNVTATAAGLPDARPGS